MWILTNKLDAMDVETASPKASHTKTTEGRTPTLSRELQYGRALKRSKMLEKVPDVSNTLIRTRVDPLVRGRLIGWIVEVLTLLQDKCDYSQVFRTILIMDLYMKHYPHSIEDDDMHLIGVTSLFIASKYETNAHLDINDLTIRACHGKFTNDQIFEREFIVMKTLGFIISYPSHVDVLRLLLFDMFEHNNVVFKTMEMLSTNLLLFCLMDVNFNNYKTEDFMFAVIITSVKYYYSCKIACMTGALSFGTAERYSKQEKIIVKQILSSTGKSTDISTFSRLIRKYLKNFKERYRDSTFVIKLFDYNEDLM